MDLHKIALRDDHAWLVVPALGKMLDKAAQASPFGGNVRVMLDIIGRKPLLQRCEVVFREGLRQDFDDDRLVAGGFVCHGDAPFGKGKLILVPG